jgi:hypothetical protein
MPDHTISKKYAPFLPIACAVEIGGIWSLMVSIKMFQESDYELPGMIAIMFTLGAIATPCILLSGKEKGWGGTALMLYWVCTILLTYVGIGVLDLDKLPRYQKVYVIMCTVLFTTTLCYSAIAVGFMARMEYLQRSTQIAANARDLEGQQQREYQEPNLTVISKSISAVEPVKCSICLVDTDRHPAIWRPCGHKFHEECINKWISEKARNTKTCPECRAVLDMNSSVVEKQQQQTTESIIIIPTPSQPPLQNHHIQMNPTQPTID